MNKILGHAFFTNSSFAIMLRKLLEKINLALGNGSVSERSTQRYFQKFKSGNFSIENDDRRKPDIVVSNDYLKAID